VITTPYGRTLNASGALTGDLEDPGALLEFTYTGLQSDSSR